MHPSSDTIMLWISYTIILAYGCFASTAATVNSNSSSSRVPIPSTSKKPVKRTLFNQFSSGHNHQHQNVVQQPPHKLERRIATSTSHHHHQIDGYFHHRQPNGGGVGGGDVYHQLKNRYIQNVPNTDFSEPPTLLMHYSSQRDPLLFDTGSNYLLAEDTVNSRIIEKPIYIREPEPIIEIIIKESNVTLPPPLAAIPHQPYNNKKKKEQVQVFYVKYKKNPNGSGKDSIIYDPPIPAISPPIPEDEEQEEIPQEPIYEAVTHAPKTTTTLRTVIHPDSEVYHSHGSGIKVTFGKEGFDYEKRSAAIAAKPQARQLDAGPTDFGFVRQSLPPAPNQFPQPPPPPSATSQGNNFFGRQPVPYRPLNQPPPTIYNNNQGEDYLVPPPPEAPTINYHQHQNHHHQAQFNRNEENRRPPQFNGVNQEKRQPPPPSPPPLLPQLTHFSNTNNNGNQGKLPLPQLFNQEKYRQPQLSNFNGNHYQQHQQQQSHLNGPPPSEQPELIASLPKFEQHIQFQGTPAPPSPPPPPPQQQQQQFLSAEDYNRQIQQQFHRLNTTPRIPQVITTPRRRPTTPPTATRTTTTTTTPAPFASLENSQIISTTTLDPAVLNARLPDEVPEELRQQLLASGILNHADISILDYDKVGDIPLSALPPDQLANFYSAGGAQQLAVAASGHRPTVLTSSTEIKAPVNRRRDQQRLTPSLAPAVQMKIVHYDPKTADGQRVQDNYVVDEQTKDQIVTKPVVLNDNAYTRYLPLKLSGAQFPIPHLAEFEQKRISSVVVLAPISYDFSSGGSVTDNVEGQRPTRNVDNGGSGMGLIRAPHLLQLLQEQNVENYRYFLDVENHTRVDQQSVILLVTSSSGGDNERNVRRNNDDTPNSSREIYMYDVGTQIVNRLNGSLSSAFVDAAEANAETDDPTAVEATSFIEKHVPIEGIVDDIVRSRQTPSFQTDESVDQATFERDTYEGA